MTDHIEPALSQAEFARLRTGADYLGFAMETNDEIKDHPAQALAVANAYLPDSDVRKITRAKLRRIRQFMGVHEDEETDFLDALASYLPPD